MGLARVGCEKRKEVERYELESGERVAETRNVRSDEPVWETKCAYQKCSPD